MQTRLTKRQLEILEFFREYVAREGRAPALKLMAEHFEIQPPTMVYHMNRLRKAGYLSPAPPGKLFPTSALHECSRESCFRRIKVIRKPGDPDDEQWKKEKYVLAPDEAVDICDPAEMIAFEVPDDSMFGVGIHVGDIVIGVPMRYMKPQSGDIVVAELPREGLVVRTLRTFSPFRVDLVPANPDYLSRPLLLKRVAELAVVVSLVRHF